MAIDGPVLGPIVNQWSEKPVVVQKTVKSRAAMGKAPSREKNKGGGGKDGQEQADSSESQKQYSQGNQDKLSTRQKKHRVAIFQRKRPAGQERDILPW